MVAVVLTGPPGAGKTSVLTALADALSDDDIAHAAVEVETLVWTHPALTDEQWTRQLRSTCSVYRDAGFELLLVAQTLETDDDVAQLIDAVGADERPVRLEAQPDTLVERIVEREPASWSGLQGLVAHARVLAETMKALSGVDLVLSTEGAGAEEVAARIRRPARWLAAAPEARSRRCLLRPPIRAALRRAQTCRRASRCSRTRPHTSATGPRWRSLSGLMTERTAWTGRRRCRSRRR